MENIKPEMPLKCSMSREKNICVCPYIIQRIPKTNGKFLLRHTHTKKKNLENTTSVIFFPEHKNFFLKVVFISSCIFIR